MNLTAKPKADSENPSTTLRTSLSQPEPIAILDFIIQIIY